MPDLIVDDQCDPADLAQYRKKYEAQLERGEPTIEATFEYAWCLVRSSSRDIRLGLAMLRSLLERDEGDALAKRDYLYYLAVGELKLKNYEQSLKYVDALIRAEPENMQAQDLRRLIDARMKRDGLIGGAILGGALLAGGAALVGVIAALATRRQN